MPSGDRVRQEMYLRSAVLAGDEHAWRAWYDECFAGLESYVFWRCAGLRELAEDVIQETWLTAVRRVGSFDPEAGSFAGWLRGIAANVIRHHLRAGVNHRSRPLEGSNDAAVDPACEQRETAERVTRALAGLPEHYEAVLRAKYLEQQTVEVIAAERGQTPKAIESLLTRARQAFREKFQHD